MALGVHLPTQGPEKDRSIPRALATAAFVLASVLLFGWWLW